MSESPVFALVRLTLSYLLVMSPLTVVIALHRAWFRRRQSDSPQTVLLAATVDVMLMNSLLGIVLVTLLPQGRTRHPPVLCPLLATYHIVRHSSPQSALVQVGGNVLLFFPLGFFAPLSVPSLDVGWRIMLCGAGLSASVETLQYVLPIRRTAASDDVLFNTLGAFLGYILLSRMRRKALIANLLARVF